MIDALDGGHHPPTLGDILRINAERNPERVALSFDGAPTTYANLLIASVRVTNALRVSGLERGDRIATLARNGRDFFELLFGAAMLGVVLVPINWRLTAPEIATLISDSGAKLVFVGREYAATAEHAICAECSASIIILDEDGAQNYSAWCDFAGDDDHYDPVTPEMVALQLYTSGTTGKPKGALLSHHGLNSVRVSQPRTSWNSWSSDDVCLVSMPLFHIGGIGIALAAIYHGARIVIARDFTPEAVLDHIAHDGITRLFLAPTAIQMVVDNPSAHLVDYSRLRFVHYGSSPISAELLRRAMAIFQCGFVQLYGMTETSGCVVALSPEDHARPPGSRMASAGKALTGVEIAILDAAGTDVPQGQVGEVAIRSQANMLGYWGMADAAVGCLLPSGFLRSGDVGYLDEDGYLFLRDRLKDVIISGGENVYAVEVEARLCEHPGVAEAAVVGIADALWGEAVTAVIVTSDGRHIDIADLRAWVRVGLAGYKVPKAFHFQPSLPKNAAGKVLRRELRERYSPSARIEICR